jgi:AcrR family transcriptional regulator
MTATPKKPSARQRLLDAADELFYGEGIHTVGIDRVIEKAGVAKGSLYYIFGSKDELVRSYLRNRHELWSTRIDERLAAALTPRDGVLSVFDALGDLFAEPEFNGCAFTNAAAEAPPGSAELDMSSEFRRWVHELFAGLCREAGLAEPDALASQLVVLYDGANASAALDHDPAAARRGRDIAEILLDAAASSRINPNQ